MRAYVPRRGDAIWLQFNPQAGSEQAGRRPALVISPEAYNRRVGLMICCPITNQQKGYPFEVVLPDGAGITGVILSDQIKSLDWRALQADFFAQLPEDVVAEVLAKLNTLLH